MSSTRPSHMTMVPKVGGGSIKGVKNKEGLARKINVIIFYIITNYSPHVRKLAL